MRAAALLAVLPLSGCWVAWEVANIGHDDATTSASSSSSGASSSTSSSGGTGGTGGETGTGGTGGSSSTSSSSTSTTSSSSSGAPNCTSVGIDFGTACLASAACVEPAGEYWPGGTIVIDCGGGPVPQGAEPCIGTCNGAGHYCTLPEGSGIQMGKCPAGQSSCSPPGC